MKKRDDATESLNLQLKSLEKVNGVTKKAEITNLHNLGQYGKTFPFSKMPSK